jgi:hypothetical protein
LENVDWKALPPKGCLIALATSVVLVILLALVFWLNFYYVHVRYRLTVEVQDGDQIKTGSSVIDGSYPMKPNWSPGHPTSDTGYDGYAPTVDLGDKGMLFLAFSPPERTPEQQRERNRLVSCTFDDVGCLPFAAYHKPGPNSDSTQKKAALAELLRQRGPRDLPFVVLTEFIRFVDVDGQHKYVHIRPDNLASAFGPGVELKRVTLELTDDPVTPMPEIWPAWLKKNGEMEGMLKGSHRD